MITEAKFQADTILVEDDATALEEDPSRLAITDETADLYWYQRIDFWKYLYSSIRPQNFLEIPLKCIPISADAYAIQMKWTDWLLLLKRSSTEGIFSC